MATRPVPVVPPGEHLREEIEARGWSQADFAKILGRPEKVVSEVVNGKRGITPETAQEIAAALGTTAMLWMNLESAYRLSLASPNNPGSQIAKRAALYEKVPVNDLVKRGWIGRSSQTVELERSVLAFFKAASIDEPFLPPAAAAARTGLNPTHSFTVPQVAWLRKVEELASRATAKHFDLRRFRNGLSSLRDFAERRERIGEIPVFLADLGVRMVIVEHLKRTKIDGGCVWLDKATPVIALSLRYDRIDHFWQTLVHECAHVFYQDQVSLDEAGGDGPREDYERRADDFAVDFLIPRKQFEDFVVRSGPYFAKEQILGFAARMRVHPGIVAGQLQYHTKKYTHYRKMLEKVRSFIVRKTITDGWDSVEAT